MFVKMGLDPEYLVYSHKLRRVVPAHTAGISLAHSHLGQYEILTTPEYSVGSFFRDGWAVELNPRPSTCREAVGSATRSLHHWVQHRVLEPQGYHLLHVPAAEISLEDLEDAPSDVRAVGCRPAFDAYREDVAASPFDPLTVPYRTAGWHLHLSVLAPDEPPRTWEALNEWYYRTYGASAYHTNTAESLPVWMDDFPSVCRFVKLLDKYVGLPLTYLQGNKSHGLRRQFYGRAGEFRLQNHRGGKGGIEYRTPGTDALHSQHLLGFMLGVARHIYMNYPEVWSRHRPEDEESIRAAINRGESHPDLLDLVSPCPGYYNADVLKLAKNLPLPTLSMIGWGEWLESVSYVQLDRIVTY